MPATTAFVFRLLPPALIKKTVPIAAALLLTPCIAAAGPAATWLTQLGGTSYDSFRAVATDASGNAVVAGQADYRDPWLAKYSAAGKLLWERRLTGSILNAAWGVAIDKLGNIVVAGDTTYSSTKGVDAWVAKYTSGGSRIWSRQFNSGGREGDKEFRVAVDSANNIYIAGTSGQPTAAQDNDALLVKYSPAGVLQWKKRIGTTDDTVCNGVSVDRNNNIVLVGTTFGPLFGPDPAYLNRDAWVAKLDPSGRVLWGRQIHLPRSGSSITYGNAVGTDPSGNVLVVGRINGNGRLPGSSQDGRLYLIKFTGSGAQSWVRQFQYPGSTGSQEALAVAADASGNILMTGDIGIDVAGGDAYVRKYSPSGALQWDSVIAFGGGEQGHGVAADTSGNVYVAGHTYGIRGSVKQGRSDGFLAKFPPR